VNHNATQSFIFGFGKKCSARHTNLIESFELWFKMPTTWFKNMFSQKLSDKAMPAVVTELCRSAGCAYA